MMRAALKHVIGSKTRRSVMVGRGGMADTPDPVALRVLRDGAGFTLLRLDAAGVSLSHTWHATIEDAKLRAAREYGVADEDWEREPVSPA